LNYKCWVKKKLLRRDIRFRQQQTLRYYFFSGIAGVTGCAPPVDFGPGVTPALFSVELLELLAAAASLFGFAPFVGPLPASVVDVAPFVGPLPASIFVCAYAAKGTQRAIPETSMYLANVNMKDLPMVVG
jgi:hypothetical protein